MFFSSRTSGLGILPSPTPPRTRPAPWLRLVSSGPWLSVPCARTYPATRSPRHSHGDCCLFSLSPTRGAGLEPCPPPPSVSPLPQQLPSSVRWSTVIAVSPASSLQAESRQPALLFLPHLQAVAPQLLLSDAGGREKGAQSSGEQGLLSSATWFAPNHMGL